MIGTCWPLTDPAGSEGIGRTERRSVTHWVPVVVCNGELNTSESSTDGGIREGFGLPCDANAWIEIVVVTGYASIGNSRVARDKPDRQENWGSGCFDGLASRPACARTNPRAKSGSQRKPAEIVKFGVTLYWSAT